MPDKFVWKRMASFFVHRVLHVPDTPHRIALGVAIGIFVAWTPTIRFQMVLTVVLAWLLGANKSVGVPFVWISCPPYLRAHLPTQLLCRSVDSTERSVSAGLRKNSQRHRGLVRQGQHMVVRGLGRDPAAVGRESAGGASLGCSDLLFHPLCCGHLPV